MSDDEWMKAAGVDDTMVAELLLWLKEVKPNPPSPTPLKTGLSLEWSVRQRRSKAVIVGAKKQAPWSSPTTPLSWSGATSISGGGVGGGGSGSGGAFEVGHDEQSSRSSPPSQPKRSDTSRSKVIGTREPSNSKRSRRKKTLAELKEEEDLLQKEKRQLKRELVTLRFNLENARTTNENLKRIKFDLQATPSAESSIVVSSKMAISAQLQQKIVSLDAIPAILPAITAGNTELLQFPPPNDSSEAKTEVTAGKFVLPDLNLPVEEISSSDILNGES